MLFSPPTSLQSCMREFHVHKQERERISNSQPDMKQYMDAVLDGDKADGRPVHVRAAAVCVALLHIRTCWWPALLCAVDRCTCVASRLQHIFCIFLSSVALHCCIGAFLAAQNDSRPSRAVYVLLIFFSWNFIPICYQTYVRH